MVHKLFLSILGLTFAAAIETDTDVAFPGGGGIMEGYFELKTSLMTGSHLKWLRALGYSKEAVKSITKWKMLGLHVERDSDDEESPWTTQIYSGEGGLFIQSSFFPGMEFKEKLSDKRVITSLVEVDQKNHKFYKTLKFGDFEAKETWEFTEDGVKIIGNLNDIKLTMKWKRVDMPDAFAVASLQQRMPANVLPRNLGGILKEVEAVDKELHQDRLDMGTLDQKIVFKSEFSQE